ncbi:hypothetical protein BK750_00200 [Bacillus thuringiensis serovar jegathesan]|uniref:Crystaline entomocidal protoxin n=2 Tax=Bacillus thuringiensis TaxID=1428 RepID=A0A9X6MJ58_BACTJ|nr:hypothetical protein BK750_00200 [Bacillus thuringiensis serovar jegathesan]
MNPYQNQNECEILNAPLNNINMPNRYPFANDPNAVMKNGNYKDWLNECDGITPSIFGTLGVLASIVISTINLATSPSIGDAFALVSSIGEVLTGDEDLVPLSVADVNRLIREALDQNAINRATGKFNGLMDTYNTVYLKNLQDWYDTRIPANPQGDSQLREAARRSLEEIERDFRKALAGEFAEAGSQIVLLPIYAQAANIHLLILKDAMQFRTDLGLIRPVGVPITTSAEDPFESEFLLRIKKYTDHCISYYDDGLAKIRSRGSDGETWWEFNKFRREMTLTVLDLVALYPTHNIKLYPIPTQTELSRVVYTDPVGCFGNRKSDIFSRLNFDYLENRLTRPPEPFNYLNSVQLFASTVSNSNNGEVLRGNLNKIMFEGGWTASRSGDGVTTGTPFSTMDWSYGWGYPRKHYAEITSRSQALPGLNNSIHVTVGIDSFRAIGPGGQGDHTFSLPGGDMYDCGKVQINPLEDYRNSDHWISDMMTINQSVQLASNPTQTFAFSALSLGWHHSSAGNRNVYVYDKITQIPATKTVREHPMIKGPGFTGGDLADLSSNSDILQYDLRSDYDDRLTEDVPFRIRIRCASIGVSTISVDNWGSSSPQVTVASTAASLDTLKYESFQYVSIPGNYYFDSAPRIRLLRHAGRLLVDRIEIIPVNFFPLSEQENKSVDSLFIN